MTRGLLMLTYADQDKCFSDMMYDKLIIIEKKSAAIPLYPEAYPQDLQLHCLYIYLTTY